MPSAFCCYDNSDVIVILIIGGNEFSQAFVNGNVAYAQTWEVFTLKNPIEAP